MRINQLFSIVAGSVLTAILASGSFAGTNPPKAKTYDITLDGFCDGMNLTISDKVYVVGQSTGCYVGAVNEGFVATRGGSKFLDVSSNDGGGGLPLTYVFDYPGNGNGWCDYYTSDGITQVALHCGTYTIGAPGSRGQIGSADRSQ